MQADGNYNLGTQYVTQCSFACVPDAISQSEPVCPNLYCGGVDCPGCGETAPNNVCALGSDCVSDQCEALVCTSCSNGVKDAVSAETDVDCGGALCGKCIVGQDCGADSDCSTGKCDSGTNKCRELTPSDTCTDAAKGEMETDVDCGGPQCVSIGLPCALTKECTANADCESGICDTTAGTPVCVSCADSLKNKAVEDRKSVV